MSPSLDETHLRQVRELHERLGAGDDLTPDRWEALATLRDAIATSLGVPGPSERFALVRDDGTITSMHGPRWWFHLLGLRHGSIHVILTTPQGWFVVQRRSPEKDDAAGALDVAVGGHIGTADPFSSAWRELEEELGLIQADDGALPDLEGNAFTPLGTYEAVNLTRVGENPPFIDREYRWIYQARLTATGLAHLRFADGEVTSLMLLGPRDMRSLAQRCLREERHAHGELDLASGIIGSLPRWLAAMEDR